MTFPKIRLSMEGRERARDIVSTQRKVTGSLTNKRNHVRTVLPGFIDYLQNIQNLRLRSPRPMGQGIGTGVLRASGPVFVAVSAIEI